jgi:hypothetical protein
MNELEHLWFGFWDIFRHGVAHISNPIVVIVIALLAGLMVRSFLNLFIISVLAVLVHILAEAVIPVAMSQAPLVFPKFDHGLLQYVLTLYVVYLVVTLAIYTVKLIFARARG